MAWLKTVVAAGTAMALLAAAGGADAQRRRVTDGGDSCVRASRPGLLAESPGGRIMLDDGAERVTLLSVCGEPLAQQVQRGRGRRFILLVDDLRAERPTGAVFSLHLAEPSGAESDAVLGSLSFFAARPNAAPGATRRVSYDVTNTVRGLAEAGRLEQGLVVLLRPGGQPTPGAMASVSRLQLVEQ